MFLFFLEEEFLRFNDHHRPFSLVMISLKRDRAEPINPADLIQRMRGLGTILRASDRFCHFQNSSFGIVLPETTEVEAKAIVRNIVNQLTKITPENVGSRGTFSIEIGSASVPVDCDSVGNLVDWLSNRTTRRFSCSSSAVGKFSFAIIDALISI